MMGPASVAMSSFVRNLFFQWSRLWLSDSDLDFLIEEVGNFPFQMETKT